MTPEEFARDSWKKEGPTGSPPDLEDLRDRAGKFRNKVRRRNTIEFLAGGLVIVVFAAIAWSAPISLVRVGAALVIAGACIVCWQLFRRTTPLSPPEKGGKLSVLEFHKRELTRQRDALKSIIGWYILPLLPGVTFMLSIPLLSGAESPLNEEPPYTLLKLGLLVVLTVFLVVANRVAAGKLQTEIEEIDALLES